MFQSVGSEFGPRGKRVESGTLARWEWGAGGVVGHRVSYRFPFLKPSPLPLHLPTSWGRDGE